MMNLQNECFALSILGVYTHNNNISESRSPLVFVHLPPSRFSDLWESLHHRVNTQGVPRAKKEWSFVVWCGAGQLWFKRDTPHSLVVISVKIFQTETAIEIQLVSPTEVCGKV